MPNPNARSVEEMSDQMSDEISGRDSVSKMNLQYMAGHPQVILFMLRALLESLTLITCENSLIVFTVSGDMPCNLLMTAGEIKPFIDDPVHPQSTFLTRNIYRRKRRVDR